MLLMEKNAPMRSSKEDADGFEDRWELIIEKGTTEIINALLTQKSQLMYDCQFNSQVKHRLHL